MNATKTNEVKENIMDEQLAAIYGTNQNTEPEDQEKLAAAELLVKLAEEEGVDLNQFSDEEISNMVQELYAGEQTPEAEKTAEAESQEKLAEADFLGRVMAHAYTQELGEIEKQAGKVSDAAKATKSFLSKIKEKAVGAGKATSHFAKGQATRAKEGITGWERAGRGGGSVGLSPWERAKKLGPAAGAAAGVGGAAVGAHHLLKKKESAADLDKLAEDRAIQMLVENGWIDEQGNPLVQPGQEKQAEMSQEQMVETRALQMLEGAGYPVTWNQ
jgi:hypothetical protein